MHKKSPAHEYNAQLGAQFAMTGDGMVVEHYGDPEGEAKALWSEAALMDLSHLSVVRITGPDGRDFLQRLTTTDFRTLTEGKTASGAFLNANGTIVSIFHVVSGHHFFDLILTPELRTLTLDFLNKFHFSENLKIEDVSEKFALFSLQGPLALSKFKKYFPDVAVPAMGTNETFVLEDGQSVQAVGLAEIFDNEFYFSCERSQFLEVFKFFIEQGKTHGVTPVGRLAHEYCRLEKGVPVWGADLDHAHIISECRLDNYVSENKGCYPGQEIVERIKTYGEVAKKLVVLEVSSVFPLKKGDPIFNNEKKEVGVVTSSARPPWRDANSLVMAYVKRGANAVGNSLHIKSDHSGHADGTVDAKVLM